MAKALMLFIFVAGCDLVADTPRDLYWNPLTCRCHASATGGFVDTYDCLKPGVKLDACPQTEE